MIIVALQVKDHEYVRDNESCRPIVINTMKFLYQLDMDESREVDMSNPIARPRVPHEVRVFSFLPNRLSVPPYLRRYMSLLNRPKPSLRCQVPPATHSSRS